MPGVLRVGQDRGDGGDGPPALAEAGVGGRVGVEPVDDGVDAEPVHYAPREDVRDRLVVRGVED